MRKEFAQHLNTPDGALEFARELRNAADSARNRFYEFLVEIEKRPELWSLSGATFVDYLARTHLGSAAVYERWKKGRGILRPEVSESLGFYATEQIARIDDESDRRAALVQMSKTYESEGEVALSGHRARQIVNDYLPKAPAPRRKTYAQVVRENERLREENKKLRARIRELSGDVADAAQ